MRAGIVFDEANNLVGFTYMGFARQPVVGKGTIMTFSLVSGTREGMRAVLQAVRCYARREATDCDLILGYMPDVDWVHEMMPTLSYKRPSETYELNFEWQNSELVS